MPIGTALALGALGGAALGAGHYASQQGQAASDKKLAAATQRYSPWTHLQAGPITRPDLVGDLAGGTISGAAFGQGLGGAEAPAANLGTSEAMNAMPASGVGMGTGMGLNYGVSPWLGQMPGEMSPQMLAKR